MTDHGHAGDLAGPYALGACPPEEARSVADHARHCPTCAAEIAELSRVTEWIGATTARTPAPALRSRVLSAALAARPAGAERPADGERPVGAARSAGAERPADGERPVGAARSAGADEARRLVELYRVQVDELDRLLRRLSPP